MLFYFFLGAAVGLTSAVPANAQNLLDRLENRVRERIGGETAPQPTDPPNLQSPPLRPEAAEAAADDSPRLGLEAEERGPAPPFQVVINGVRPGSAAARAGLQQGDVIRSVDGREVGAIEDISEVLRTKRSGDSMRMGVRRGDRQIDIDVNFVAGGNPPERRSADARRSADEMERHFAPEDRDGERPGPSVVERPPSGSGRIGVTVENPSSTPPGPGVPVRRGAVVVAVVPGSPADVAELRPGNVIVAVDGRVVQNAAGLIEEMGATVPGQQIEISFYRGETLVRTPLRLAGEDGLAAGPAPGEARLGAPSGATPLGGAAAAAPPNGLLGGLSQAIGGMFGRSDSPAEPRPGFSDPPAATAPASEPAPMTEAAPATEPVPSSEAVPATEPVPSSEPAPATEPIPATEPAPASPPSPFALPESPDDATRSAAESAPPAAADASVGPMQSVGPVETGAEVVPLPAGGPDEIRQLLDKIQAMQRRIDVLERRLTELESESAAR